MPHSVKIKSEEETLPRLTQTGESASSYLTRTQLPSRLEARGTPPLTDGRGSLRTFAADGAEEEGDGTLHIKAAGRQVERGALRTFAAGKAGGALHLELAGRRSKCDSLRTFVATEGSEQAPLTEKGARPSTSSGSASNASL